MRHAIRGLLILMTGLSACQSPSSVSPEHNNSSAQNGLWRGGIALNDSIDLAFNFRWPERGDSLLIYNNEETIVAAMDSLAPDSFRVQMPVFANYLLVQATQEGMKGQYVNPDAEDYRLPFRATYGDTFRYRTAQKPCCAPDGRWAVQLETETADPKPAIAHFQSSGQKVAGTFMTETGDYRYLAGSISGAKMRLSAFDGAHLFYFEARLSEDSLSEGLFYSGRSYQAHWYGYHDSTLQLRAPDTLTYLKKGYEGIAFSFPTLAGDTLSLKDPRFEGHPVVVQIMGSWCPNCMDESRYLRQVHEQYYDQGLRMVGLTFERARNRATALKRARKMKRDLQLPYPVLLAGATREDDAEEALPMLNHVMSYPTTIYLDEKHRVQKIHTGFSGPGTPVYPEFVRENNAFLQRLVRGSSETP
ncbi:MAG: TlpA disulfide reductase family protein [Schleiferiaceae bacterium]|nr:TlpA disulfide reductase family protein [Schleiferiaceae bacterium]